MQFVHVYVENCQFPNACNNESGFDVLWVLHSCLWQGLSLIGGACINIFGGSYEFKKETELCENIYIYIYIKYQFVRHEPKYTDEAKNRVSGLFFSTHTTMKMLV